MRLQYFVAIFAVLSPSFAYDSMDPFSDEFINYINSQQSTWKAGRNFKIGTPIKMLYLLAGVIRDNKVNRLPEEVRVEEVPIPDAFDARKHWPECAEIIGDIRDQSNCGSCWAFGAVEAMSDRLCIHSKGKVKVSVSAEDLVSCCRSCGFGCYGGATGPAWRYWTWHGIVTGGGYNSTNGCKAYSIPPCKHHVHHGKPACDDLHPTPKCTATCDDGSSSKPARTYGKSHYSLARNVSQIQLDVMKNGTVEGTLEMYPDFVHYKSGVYQHLNDTFLGAHAVKILGWGIEQDVPYWLVANSWNSEWGDKGYFKILRGRNECGIENEIVAGLPQIY